MPLEKLDPIPLMPYWKHQPPLVQSQRLNNQSIGAINFLWIGENLPAAVWPAVQAAIASAPALQEEPSCPQIKDAMTSMFKADPWLKSFWLLAIKAAVVRPSRPFSKSILGSEQLPRSSAARFNFAEAAALQACSWATQSETDPANDPELTASAHAFCWTWEEWVRFGRVIEWQSIYRAWSLDGSSFVEEGCTVDFKWSVGRGRDDWGWRSAQIASERLNIIWRTLVHQVWSGKKGRETYYQRLKWLRR